jgi:uncharacterized protein (DUF1778 family)
MSTISLRIPPDTRDLIDRAAKATGQTRTDFMLGTAKRAAEEALLDQRFFHLETAEYEAFLEALDAAQAAECATTVGEMRHHRGRSEPAGSAQPDARLLPIR